MHIDILFSDGRLKGCAATIPVVSARVGSAIARAVGCSCVGHVAVGFNGYVLDPQLRGDRVYARDVYVLKYPGLRFWAEVPGELPFSIHQLARGYRGRRCVQTACRVLRLAGQPVPEFRLPSTLLEWIRDHGYEIDPVE